MAKIWVEAYGCSASFADSEMISGLIVNGGHILAANSSDSDLNLIVTCSVKDATANKMVNRIKNLKSKPLVVAGCLPKAEQKTVEKFSQNASLLGPNSLGKTLEVISTTLSGGRMIQLEDSDLSKIGLPKVRLNPAVGIVEDLSSLINAVIEIPSKFKIRVGMMNPMYMPRIREGLLKSFDNDKVFKFLNIPVQSGSDKILNDMKRGHTAKTFTDVVYKFRKKFSKFTIATDIIVGFPSETQEDFKQTIDLLNDTRPDIVNLSRYSPRPGTKAADYTQIDVSEVKRRSKIVFDVSSQISFENNLKWIGWKGEVLFDEKSETGIQGRNFAYKSILVKDKVEIGQVHQVEIIDATKHCLIGKIAS